MKPPRSIKVVKNAERTEPEIQTEADVSQDPGKWSTEVRSWVAERRQDRRVESLPAFDSLFKDEHPESGQTD
jgi:hypothetical protein